MAGYVESTPLCPIGGGTPVSPCLVVVVVADIYVSWGCCWYGVWKFHSLSPLYRTIVIWNKRPMDAVIYNDSSLRYGGLKMAVEEVLLKRRVNLGVAIGGLVLWMFLWVAWKSYSLRVSMAL